MIGFNFDLNLLSNNWKQTLVGVGVNCFFWYLSFFLLNKSLITNYPFYVPFILAIPLAVVFFQISALLGFSVFVITNSKDLKDDKGFKKKYGNKTIDEIKLEKGLNYSVFMFVGMLIAEYETGFDIPLKTFVFNSFAAITILSSVALAIACIIIFRISKKQKKETVSNVSKSL